MGLDISGRRERAATVLCGASDAASFEMGRKALAVLCWLAISEACSGTVIQLGLKENESADSTPRLYRNAPFGVYASAAPYGAFSFHVPTSFATKPTQLVPLKQESILVQASNAYLRDSYGNKFIETPQTVAYKTSFPQQFVQLQNLPSHLAQPLTAAPNYHFPQGPPQAFFGSQFRIPSADAVSSLTRYGVSQPFVYGGGVKSLTPASDQQFQFIAPIKAQQDASNQQKAVYSIQGYNQVQNEPKFHRLEAKPAEHQNAHQEAHRQPQVAPSTREQVQTPVIHSVKTIQNGKETVVHLETKPPLPLLDLSLLEPLTFANPVVPQVQHYLPKINAVTYHKLPLADVDEVKKHKNEFVVQKTKSYDSGLIKGKPHNAEPKRKQKKPPPKKDADVYVHYEQKSEKPSIQVKGKPNDPEYSYEINSPNYKETYNEQVVSYNKETQSDPVNYTYQKETQKKPVSYSFSHSSKDPGQTKKVQYVKKDPVPNHLIHKFQPGEHREAPSAAPDTEDDDSGESSDADDDSQSYDHSQYAGEHDKPSHSHTSPHSDHSTPSSHSHLSNPSYNHHHHPSHSQPSTHSHHSTQSHHPSTQSHHAPAQSHHPSSQSHHPSSQSYHPTRQSHHSSSQSHHPSTQSHRPPSHSHPSTHSHYSGGPHSSPHSHQGHPQHLKAEHREQENHSPNPVYYAVSPKPTQYYTHSPQSVAPELQPLQEFMENLRFIPSYASAAIRVDPNQHVQKQQQKQQVTPQYFIQQTTPRARSEGHVSSEPIIYEKSKKIIIQEESPDEVHSHQEKLTAQMIGQEENSEKDFEKSYKEAAYGFPAYDRDSSESEDEIYNPENYGVPHNSGEDTGHSTFEQYQEEGDEFPKFSRLGYKDARDKMKENYFLDYSVHKPESMTDRYQSKINYYKMFLKHKPEHHRAHESEDKKKQSAKYTVSPSFFDSEPRQKSKSAQYKSAPAFEYDYLKDSRDSSAHASRPSLRFKSRTHFVEPQFQYGFEPIAIPRLDSELDTMASNVSPESEKPGTRKKVFKENWYIKKTSTSSKPSS